MSNPESYNNQASTNPESSQKHRSWPSLKELLAIVASAWVIALSASWCNNPSPSRERQKTRQQIEQLTNKQYMQEGDVADTQGQIDELEDELRDWTVKYEETREEYENVLDDPSQEEMINDLDQSLRQLRDVIEDLENRHDALKNDNNESRRWLSITKSKKAWKEARLRASNWWHRWPKKNPHRWKKRKQTQ